MECRKCKHHYSDKYVICPNCGTPLKSKKVNNKSNTKNIRNKYIKKADSELVGSKTTGSGSYVKINRKNNVSKNDTKEEKIFESKKYKSTVLKDENVESSRTFFSIITIEKVKKENEAISQYKKSIADKNIDGKKTGASNAKVKVSRTTREAAVKAKREEDIAKVGNVSKAYKYSSRLKDKNKKESVDNISNRNGKFFGNGRSIEVNSPKKNKNKKKIGAFDIFAYVAVISVWIVAVGMIIKISANNYYFGDKEQQEIVDYDGVSKSNQVAGLSGLGVTSVVYDNQYFKQTTLTSMNDVKNLIIKDSNKQKSKCSTDIIAIENEIINKYGITAVNFCEIDLGLANELKDIVAYIYNHYPTAREYLTNITIANVGANETYIAAFMPIFTFATSNTSSGYPIGVKTQIILNAKYFLNTNKLKNSVSSGSATGYFPANASSSSTVAHEFGHYLSYVALLNNYKSKKLNYVDSADSKGLYEVYSDFNAGNYSKKLLQEAYDEYQKIYLSNMTFDEFRKSISIYAVAKNGKGQYIYDETIAEAFHDCYLNGENAAPASKVIVEVLESKL